LVVTDWLPQIHDALPEGTDVIHAALQLLLGLTLAIGISRLGRRIATQRFTPAQAEVAGRLLFGGFASLGVASALAELGFDLSFLMGAAGLLTVALGFASQTSASNLISGLFLLFERPFSIRDVIQVGGTTGEVVSIDLLSVRLRTFDNRLVRVPNETLLKSDITNLSHFPVRRSDLVMQVAYDVDLDRVRALLLGVAESTNTVLDEPRPMLQFVSFAERGVELQLSVWFARERFYEERTRFAFSVHRALAEAGVSFALPQRVLSGEVATRPTAGSERDNHPAGGALVGITAPPSPDKDVPPA
jgi:small-conductance mechanosensitive channel